MASTYNPSEPYQLGKDFAQFIRTLPLFAPFVNPDGTLKKSGMFRSQAQRNRSYEDASRELLHAQRLDTFKRVCDPKFCTKINRSLLPNADAYDTVFAWDGTSPGPLLVGATGTGKTRSAWSVLGKLNVEHGKSFSFLAASDLVAEIDKVRKQGGSFSEFTAKHRNSELFFVDELEKFTIQFDSQTSAIFDFYNWVYRREIPCITTTNKPRQWWEELMGPAFTRRMFDEAHTLINF